MVIHIDRSTPTCFLEVVPCILQHNFLFDAKDCETDFQLVLVVED